MRLSRGPPDRLKTLRVTAHRKACAYENGRMSGSKAGSHRHFAFIHQAGLSNLRVARLQGDNPFEGRGFRNAPPFDEVRDSDSTPRARRRTTAPSEGENQPSASPYCSRTLFWIVGSVKTRSVRRMDASRHLFPSKKRSKLQTSHCTQPPRRGFVQRCASQGDRPREPAIWPVRGGVGSGGFVTPACRRSCRRSSDRRRGGSRGPRRP